MLPQVLLLVSRCPAGTTLQALSHHLLDRAIMTSLQVDTMMTAGKYGLV